MVYVEGYGEEVRATCFQKRMAFSLTGMGDNKQFKNLLIMVVTAYGILEGRIHKRWKILTREEAMKRIY